MTSTTGFVAPSGRASGSSLGLVLGYFGWLLGMSVVCVLARAWSLLGEAWLVGGSLTAALVAVHRFAARLAARAGLDQRSLLGLLLVHVGILLAFANLWIAPRLVADPAILELLHGTGSLQRMPDWLPLAVLALGAAMLVRTAARA